MSRGITEADVFTAADSLLVAGERPTVDRIRAVLGSGSPNTVIRHLDAWWAHAGQRLSVSVQHMALPDAPESVTALASAFWAEALTAARAAMASQFAGERTELADQRTALDREREHDATQRTEQAAELTRARDAHQAMSVQLADWEQRQVAWTTEHDRLLAELQRQVALADEERHALLAVRNDLATLQKHADDERQAAVTYARSVEDRAHRAVDETRLELKTLRQALSAAAREQARRDTTHARDISALTRAKVSAEQQTARLAGRVQALESAIALLKPAARAASKPAAAPAKRVRSRKTAPPVKGD
jgi:DNA repair exonuclease SbcCD ATPase subunit